MKLSSLLFDAGENYNLVDILEMAEQADACGFERFWLGEHYDYQNLWSSPEPLIPVILGITEHITVGAAGMLLKLHSPFRIASSFKLMHLMFPDRVDLGLAGGKASNKKVTQLLLPHRDANVKVDFHEAVAELVSLLKEEQKYNEEKIFINPSRMPSPNLWLLSTSFKNIDKALQHGLHYSKSLFHKGATTEALAKDELNRFKDDFLTKYKRLPMLNLAFSGFLTRNDKETALVKKKVASSTRFDFIMPNLIGTPDYFYEKIQEYKHYYHIDDFTFLDLTEQIPRRTENIKVLSELFSLQTK